MLRDWPHAADPAVVKVHLLRHARPSLPHAGHSKVTLSHQGRADAMALVQPLRSLGITRIVSSPYRRATETIQPFAFEAGIPIETDTRLREREMPVADSPEAHIDRVRASFADADYAPVDGESFRRTTARAIACLRQRVRETPSGLLLVGHGQCLTLILRSVSAAADFDFWVALPTPAIIELTVDEHSKQGAFRFLDVQDA